MALSTLSLSVTDLESWLAYHEVKFFLSHRPDEHFVSCSGGLYFESQPVPSLIGTYVT